MSRASTSPRSIQSERLVMNVHPDDWVAKADDEVLACRGEQHHFPKMPRGEDISRRRRGIKTHTRDRDGAFVITFTCLDCGLVERTMAITPGGVDIDDVAYSYSYDDRYKAPKGTRPGRRACRAERTRRFMEAVGVG